LESKESPTGHYDALIWLLMTEFDGKEYSPSDYILQALKPQIDKARGNTVLEVHDSTVYDFTVAKGFSHYWDHFNKTAERFSNSLIILSYVSEKDIVRDCYLASLAKLYTCWDTAYLNCDVPEKITSKVFDHIVTPDELPNRLTNIITHAKE